MTEDLPETTTTAEVDAPQVSSQGEDQALARIGISLGIGLLLTLAAKLLGSFTLLLLRVDLGLLFLWTNQLVLVVLFLWEDKPASDASLRSRRLDAMDALDILTLFCQTLPWFIFSFSNPTSYRSFAQMLLAQSSLKFAYALCFGKMPGIAL